MPVEPLDKLARTLVPGHVVIEPDDDTGRSNAVYEPRLLSRSIWVWLTLAPKVATTPKMKSS